MKNSLCLIVFPIFLSISFLHAQTKITTTFEATEAGKVFIHYQLQGDPDKEYEIALALKRTSQPEFAYIPENLEGDCNKGKYALGKRLIVWNINEKESALFSEGEDFYFEVTAKIIESGGSTWYYYVGGVLVAGGAAAALLLKGGSNDGPSPPPGGTTDGGQSLPRPPGRP